MNISTFNAELRADTDSIPFGEASVAQRKSDEKINKNQKNLGFSPDSLAKKLF
jgi:hypothetical protein